MEEYSSRRNQSGYEPGRRTEQLHSRDLTVFIMAMYRHETEGAL